MYRTCACGMLQYGSGCDRSLRRYVCERESCDVEAREKRINSARASFHVSIRIVFVSQMHAIGTNKGTFLNAEDGTMPILRRQVFAVRAVGDVQIRTSMLWMNTMMIANGIANLRIMRNSAVLLMIMTLSLLRNVVRAAADVKTLQMVLPIRTEIPVCGTSVVQINAATTTTMIFRHYQCVVNVPWTFLPEMTRLVSTLTLVWLIRQVTHANGTISTRTNAAYTIPTNSRQILCVVRARAGATTSTTEPETQMATAASITRIIRSSAAC